MIALSIRQPWAWLIVNGYKNIENRDWSTNFRGQFLVHAGKKLTVDDYDAAMLFIEAFVDPALLQYIPDQAELQLGGVVGVAKLVDCVTAHESPWFTGGIATAGAQAENQAGGFGFVLRDAMPIPFMPWKGRLGFFNINPAPRLS